MRAAEVERLVWVVLVLKNNWPTSGGIALFLIIWMSLILPYQYPAMILIHYGVLLTLIIMRLTRCIKLDILIAMIQPFKMLHDLSGIDVTCN